MDPHTCFASPPGALHLACAPRAAPLTRHHRALRVPGRRRARVAATATAPGPAASGAAALGGGEMPEALRRMVASFAAVPDAKLRYQQLLFFARQLPAMDDSLKVDANLVRGCQSVVHIAVALDAGGCVRVQADSDAQLTKGLVALLVRGFDGACPADVLATDDAFLAASGLAVALTPARNNGFASALRLVKDKVRALAAAAVADAAPPAGADAADEGEFPTRAAIFRRLAELKPRSIDVVDESAQHAGHAAMRGAERRESHFAITLVSDEFDGMTLVQRHRTIYKLLAEEMAPGKIHALSIEALTPAEVKA